MLSGAAMNDEIFSVAFCTVIVMLILVYCTIFLMKLRLKRRVPTVSVKFKRPDEVMSAYRRIFPDSRLPFLTILTFWLAIAIAAASVITSLVK